MHRIFFFFVHSLIMPRSTASCIDSSMCICVYHFFLCLIRASASTARLIQPFNIFSLTRCVCVIVGALACCQYLSQFFFFTSMLSVFFSCDSVALQKLYFKHVLIFFLLLSVVVLPIKYSFIYCFSGILFLAKRHLSMAEVEKRWKATNKQLKYTQNTGTHKKKIIVIPFYTHARARPTDVIYHSKYTHEFRVEYWDLF